LEIPHTIPHTEDNKNPLTVARGRCHFKAVVMIWQEKTPPKRERGREAIKKAPAFSQGPTVIRRHTWIAISPCMAATEVDLSPMHYAERVQLYITY